MNGLALLLLAKRNYPRFGACVVPDVITCPHCTRWRAIWTWLGWP